MVGFYYIIKSMVKTKKLVNLWLPAVIWASVIFTFSSFSTVKTTDFFIGDFLLKKTAHIMEYGIFATLVYRALVNSKIEKKKAMWYAVIVALLYGISDEFHQSFIYGRTATLRDVLIDTTGAIIFIFGILKNIKKLPSTIKYYFEKLQIS